MQYKVWFIGWMALLLIGAIPAFAQRVNLDLRPDHQIVRLGDTVSVILYSVSDSGSPISVSAMDVVISWDPAYLNPISFSDTGNGYTWLQSGFLYPGGLNASLFDGDAIWTAFAQFGSPAFATPAGLRTTTFKFLALARTNQTVVSILPGTGQSGQTTVVYWGGAPNTDITGTLDAGAAIFICGPATGDVSGDGCVDDYDIALVVFAFGNTGPGMPEDLNCDEVVDDADLAEVVFNFGNGC